MPIKSVTPDISYFDFLAMICHIYQSYFQLFSLIGSGWSFWKIKKIVNLIIKAYNIVWYYYTTKIKCHTPDIFCVSPYASPILQLSYSSSLILLNYYNYCFFTTYFDFSELISLNNEKLLRFNLTYVQFSKLNLFTYTNLKNRIIFCCKIIGSQNI